MVEGVGSDGSLGMRPAVFRARKQRVLADMLRKALQLIADEAKEGDLPNLGQSLESVAQAIGDARIVRLSLLMQEAETTFEREFGDISDPVLR